MGDTKSKVMSHLLQRRDSGGCRSLGGRGNATESRKSGLGEGAQPEDSMSEGAIDRLMGLRWIEREWGMDDGR